MPDARALRRRHGSRRSIGIVATTLTAAVSLQLRRA
jgi:hypothetical protein